MTYQIKHRIKTITKNTGYIIIGSQVLYDCSRNLSSQMYDENQQMPHTTTFVSSSNVSAALDATAPVSQDAIREQIKEAISNKKMADLQKALDQLDVKQLRKYQLEGLLSTIHTSGNKEAAVAIWDKTTHIPEEIKNPYYGDSEELKIIKKCFRDFFIKNKSYEVIKHLLANGKKDAQSPIPYLLPEMYATSAIQAEDVEFLHDLIQCYSLNVNEGHQKLNLYSTRIAPPNTAPAVSPLIFFAIAEKNIEAFHLLLDKGAKVGGDVVDRHHQSVIRRIIDDAIKCHSSASEQRQKCYKMLEMAFQKSSDDLVSQDKKLVSALDLKNDILTLPLLARLVYCSDPCQETTNMVKLLLKYGADPNEKFEPMGLDDKPQEEVTPLSLLESRIESMDREEQASKVFMEQVKTLLKNHNATSSSTGDDTIME